MFASPLARLHKCGNQSNQYSSVGAQSYVYDNNGNLTSDGANTYAYDEENRLESTTNSSYAYDALGRRVSKTVSGATTDFVYDGDQVIAEYDPFGSLQAEFVAGDKLDEILSMDRGGQSYYYSYDGLGDVTELTDPSGSLVENYTYDAFGKITSPLSSVGNPYYFTGRRYDPETGDYYYRAREYDPSIGRFLQRDPIGYLDSMNLFAYVGNNPLNWIDPYGLGRFGYRRLDIDRWGWLYRLIGKEGGYLDKSNQQPAHEQYWADNGWNVGYGKKGTFSEPIGRRRDYVFHGKVYDDKLMKKAYEKIKDSPENQGDKYNLCTLTPGPQNNCQNFADRLRKEYQRLKNEQNSSQCEGKNNEH